MKTWLIRLFVHNWVRKLISLILSMIIWMVASRSMTVTKVVPNIPVRVVNLPGDKTIEGMQVNGVLSKRISLTLIGNKSGLDELTAKDLEVVIDAKDRPQEWIAAINKKNLQSLNSDFDVTKMISRVPPVEMIIRQSKLVKERIPVLVTQPIGEPPKGYQYLDIWPSQLYMTVEGPEEAVKRLKNKGLKLTLNLNDISTTELEALTAKRSISESDEISYYVPDSLKKLTLPQLSDTMVEIDDPQAKSLRIDFSRQDLLPIAFPIPVTLFFPPKHSNTLNPETYNLGTNDLIVKKNGIRVFNAPLYAQGVSHVFLDAVKDMMQIVIIATPKSERANLLWNVEFMYPHELEDRYVTKMMSQGSDESSEPLSNQHEDYLRNRFRSYMNRFRLYTADRNKLSLKIELQANTISVSQQK